MPTQILHNTFFYGVQSSKHPLVPTCSDTEIQLYLHDIKMSWHLTIYYTETAYKNR